MPTLAEAQAACDRMLRDHSVIDSYLRAQAGQPPTNPPTEPPVEPPTQPPSGDYTEIVMPWENGHKDGVHIPANGTIVIKVTTGNKPSPQGNPPNLTVSNWGDGNFGRTACFSYTPNDFAHPLSAIWPPGTMGAIQAIFSVVTPTGYYPVVPTNKALYLTVRDTSGLDSQVRINLATKE